MARLSISRLTTSELTAIASLVREGSPSHLDRDSILYLIREYFRTVRYHLDPKLEPLKSAWVKLAEGEALPPTPMLKLGPHRPKRR